MDLRYVVLFILIWATTPIFIKVGLQYASPLDFLTLRALLAASCFTLICVACHKRFSSLTRQNFFSIVSTALLLQVLYQTCFFYALQRGISPGLLMILMGTQPIFTALIMADKLTLSSWLGVFTGLSGLYLVVYDSTTTHGLNRVAITFAIISLLGTTIGTVLQKRLCSTIDFKLNLLFQYVTSSVVFLCLDRGHVIFAIPHNQQFIAALLWMGIVVSVLAIYLYYDMVNTKQLTRVTTIFYAVPMVTVIFDYFLYGKPITLLMIAGFCMICLGLYFTLQTKPPASPPTACESGERA